MLRLKGLALGLTIATGVTLPAAAQNVGNNAGIWWTPTASQAPAFTLLNPLTTVYGRVGFHLAFQRDSAIRDSLGGIPSFITLNFADAWGGELGIGFRLMPVLRYELQIGGTFNSVGRLSSTAIFMRVASAQIMNNLYLDTAPFFGNNLWGLNPYVFAGIGVSFNSNGELRNPPSMTPNAIGSDNTHASFAWNAGAGLQWQAMRNMILDVAYRYLDGGQFQTGAIAPIGGSVARFNNRSHQIMFSIVVPVDGLIRGFGN